MLFYYISQSITKLFLRTENGGNVQQQQQPPLQPQGFIGPQPNPLNKQYSSMPLQPQPLNAQPRPLNQPLNQFPPNSLQQNQFPLPNQSLQNPTQGFSQTQFPVPQKPLVGLPGDSQSSAFTGITPYNKMDSLQPGLTPIHR